jgi:hypothetical protein
MKSKRISVLILLLLSLAGCSDFFMICSLNPFYVDKNVRLVQEIEGIWNAKPKKPLPEKSKNEETNLWNRADTTLEWRIERFISRTTQKDKKGNDSLVITPMNYYSLKLMQTLPDTTLYEFRMVLFSIKNQLYADFMPAGNPGFSESRLTSESYAPVHTLARVTISGSKMNISWLGAEYMKEMIEKKHVRVNYKWVPGAKRLLLTGSSGQLTGMIDRYADQTRFIDWENQKAMLQLNRIKQ